MGLITVATLTIASLIVGPLMYRCINYEKMKRPADDVLPVSTSAVYIPELDYMMI